jgi:hypothetical protein
MAISYNIYANDGVGGPVNYTTPVATTAGLTYVSAPLPPGSDTTFAVRALDTSTSLEEANTDASTRIILDANGGDMSGRPNPPHAVALSAVSGGGCLVSWAFDAAAQFGTPVGFQVFLTEGSSVAYTSPAVTVAYVQGQVGYVYTLPGPYTRSTYSAAVRSYNTAGSDGNTVAVTAVVGLPTTPLMMDTVQVSWI